MFYHVEFRDLGYFQSRLWALAKEIDDQRFGDFVARLLKWWRKVANTKKSAVRVSSIRKAITHAGLEDFWYDPPGMLGDEHLDVFAVSRNEALEKTRAYREKLLHWLNLEIPENPWVELCTGLS